MSRSMDEISAELAELRRREKEERVRARQWVLTHSMRHTVLIIVDQSQGDVEAAAMYLGAVAAERHWPTKSDLERRHFAEDVFIHATCSYALLEYYVGLVDVASTRDPDAMRVALRYALEWRVVNWARRQNLEKQLAPDTDQLLDRLEEERLKLPEGVRPPERGTSHSSAARKWASRLRERWGGCIASIKVREHVPLQEKRDKANATWQWWNYLQSRTPPGKCLLRVNLDETAVCLHQGGGRGSLFVTKRQRAGLVESAPTNKRRCYMTHVGLICDRTDLQPLLPQVLVANEATLQAGTLAALSAACPPNVRLVRQKSSWSNGHLCALIVGLIMEALGVHAGLLQVVLILDAARLHFGPPMINACRRHGVWPLFVPAKLTWLLQPLDTHGFSLFKHTLRMAHRRARARSPDGVVPFADFLQCLYTAIRTTMLHGAPMVIGIDADGFGQRQLQLSTRVVEELQLSGEVFAPSTRPTDEQLRLCFPMRRSHPSGVCVDTRGRTSRGCSRCASRPTYLAWCSWSGPWQWQRPWRGRGRPSRGRRRSGRACVWPHPLRGKLQGSV